MITRPKVFAAEPSGEGAPAVTAMEAPELGHADAIETLSQHAETSEGPDLEAAAIVVSGGRGMGDEARFGVLSELAGLLGGGRRRHPGSSRCRLGTVFTSGRSDRQDGQT